MATIFALSSWLVMPWWLAMIFAPRWRWTTRLVSSLWIVAPPALLYVVLIGPQLGSILPLLASPTLPGIMALLGSPLGATVGWVHFLAFDLFVGRWIFLEGRRLGWPFWITSPLLALTLMIGPAGWLAALLVRSVRGAQPQSINVPQGALQ